MTDESGALEQIRGILASGRTDAETVGAIRRAVSRRPAVQHELRLDHRNWPILCASSGWERNDNPELS